MTRAELASYIDHTLLKPEATAPQIEKLCAEAIEHSFIAICVASQWVPLCHRLFKQADKIGDIHIATVAGFPHGNTLSAAKAHETRLAIDAGATEVDMVIPIGLAKMHDFGAVEKDIAAVVHAARGEALIKVIFENALLTDEEKVACCKAAQNAGADYVKTSTGFASSGATVEDIRLMRASVDGSIGVKAAGGIRDLQTALAMIEAGATRLGCSASVAILQELQES
jgi:deoxyribose-phosphate aldolase